MSHFGVAVEYALHILMQLARFQPENAPSAKVLADFQGKPPASLTSKVCTIHAVMIAAEERMREHLAGVTVADIAGPLAAKTSPELRLKAREWFASHKSPGR